MYIEVPEQILRFYNLDPKRGKASFLSRKDRRFQKLRSMLELWETTGIDARIHKHFNTLKEWEAWKEAVYFTDRDVHWHIFIQQDDGSWDFYLEQSLSFPPTLEKIYRLAESMKKQQ